MDAQLLLNDDGDIQDDVINEPPVLGPKNPLNFTSDECRLALLHSKIKHSANVPINPSFEALPQGPFRLFKLCLPNGFKATPLALFTLFFSNYIYNILAQNTNLYAQAKHAWTTHYGKGQRWRLVDKHEMSV
jgi:hypothetical protein